MTHPQQIYDREKVSFNLARLKKAGETFEIILKDPDLAISLKQGSPEDIRNILESEQIFKDAKKGELASETKLKEIFKTDDTLEIAKIIIETGEINLTTEYRKKVQENKKKKIIEYIHKNAIDSKTKLPHPISRIELAMDEAKVHIDPFRSIKVQREEIIQKLKSILPLSFDKLKIKVTIPARYASHAYGILKGKYEILNEKWENDGSITFLLESAAGLKEEIFNIINKLTNGEANIVEK